ncbi:hypothetical protein [Kiloniella sp.]|uniref:hypothetical protein n=1 Tax=Kiloniella sp. TaxID=1938587 RepID=UPI003B01B11D
MADIEGAEIIAYTPRSPQNWKQKLAFHVKRAIGYEHFGVYRSFGANSFWDASATPKQQSRARGLCEKISRELYSVDDIDAMTIDGVKVGDLIYDTYLRRNSVPTIDPRSESFRDHLQESLELFVAWNDYLDSHDVRAINVSHCVYNLALPLRIAVRRGIPVYQINPTHLYRLSERNMFAYNDFHYFPERFASMPKDLQEAGVTEAQRRIERRLSGEVGVDMAYSSKSAYGRMGESRLLSESPRKKILIATHCFFDSPHSYGNNLFPDFYTWLDFLGKMTECTDYDWYIKTHPDYLPGTMEIVKGFIARYPKLTLLPSDASHHQIVSEGIDLALTVYGTIGFEYAAMGIPVINASMNNPHVAYDFNIHPKSIDEYREILLSLDNLSFKIDRRQVYEYYFMRFIYNTENIFFDDYAGMVKKLNGYRGQFSPEVYDLWCREFSFEKHEAICSALRKFVRSGDFRMDNTHLGHANFRRNTS